MNIIGRVTKDAQVRKLSNERQVVNFSIAINDSYRNKQGERVEQTTYFDCSYWVGTKVASILTKGALVELTGRAGARAWTGNDGQLHAGLNFHTSPIKLHAGIKKAETTEHTEIAKKQKAVKDQNPDDLPF
jgi:single-strand DNA-binding protein